jgi:NAD(P)-dependent dehydrogenase (short-subunit alcohol dehydrogenase family)
MSMSFAGRVALVTGAASGIGEACAKRLAADGAAVVVADIDEVNGERVVGEIIGSGGRAAFCVTDVTNDEHTTRVVDFAVSRFGGLQLAVNNAGIGTMPTLFHETPIEVWDRLYAINLRGMMTCMRAELAHMVDHGGGAIVNMASGSGLKASWGMAPYVMTKHGVIGLTRNAAIDYANLGIRVNAVAPGPILTPAMLSFPEEQRTTWASPVPMKRFGLPEEVAEAVAWLLSDQASYTTGSVLDTDGGLTKGPPPPST